MTDARTEFAWIECMCVGSGRPIGKRCEDDLPCEACYERADTRIAALSAQGLVIVPRGMAWQQIGVADRGSTALPMICDGCKGEIKQPGSYWMIGNGRYHSRECAAIAAATPPGEAG